MAWLNKLHVALLTAGTFLSTVIVPTAARQADNTSVRIWDDILSGYTYTGCFTSDPAAPALDEGVTVTAPGRMTPSACLLACSFASKFQEVPSQDRVEFMRHIQDLKGEEECGEEDQTNKHGTDSLAVRGSELDHGKNDPMVQENHALDNNTLWQYAGLVYDEELGASVCQCSYGLATTSEDVADSKCNFPCDGNSTWACGGPNLVVLYNLTHFDEHGHPAAAGANGVSVGVLVGAFLVALGLL